MKREQETLERIAVALERIATVACWSASAYLEAHEEKFGGDHPSVAAKELGADQYDEIQLYESRDCAESIADTKAGRKP